MSNIKKIILALSKESKEVFSLIQKKGPITKNELQHLTNTNLTTLNRIMQPLEDNNLVIPVGIGESSGGRKPVLFDINNTDFYVIGIDISRLFTQIVITNLKLDVLQKKLFQMDETYTPDKTVSTIEKLYKEALRELNIEEQSILGIGLGTVGPLDRNAGIMQNPQHFPAQNWQNTPIRELLETKLGMPIYIDNGANTAILAESIFGDGKGFKNIAYFNCSVGIRTGALSSGNIVRTINDAEDAFAHMVIDVDGEKCSCGNYGCIDCYSSIFSIVQKFVSALKKGRLSHISKPVEIIDYIDICHLAEEGDELAKEIITGAATIFGVGLANYINLLNPSLIILSGPLISQSDLFYHICTEVAVNRLYTKSSNNIFFNKGGRFGDDAISIGAATMVVENYVSHSFR